MNNFIVSLMNYGLNLTSVGCFSFCCQCKSNSINMLEPQLFNFLDEVQWLHHYLIFILGNKRLSPTWTLLCQDLKRAACSERFWVRRHQWLRPRHNVRWRAHPLPRCYSFQSLGSSPNRPWQKNGINARDVEAEAEAQMEAQAKAEVEAQTEA